jgi:hypothetical protein
VKTSRSTAIPKSVAHGMGLHTKVFLCYKNTILDATEKDRGSRYFGMP